MAKRKKRYKNLETLIGRLEFERDCKDFGDRMADEIRKEIDKEIIDKINKACRPNQTSHLDRVMIRWTHSV